MFFLIGFKRGAFQYDIPSDDFAFELNFCYLTLIHRGTQETFLNARGTVTIRVVLELQCNI